MVAGVGGESGASPLAARRNPRSAELLMQMQSNERRIGRGRLFRESYAVLADINGIST